MIHLRKIILAIFDILASPFVAASSFLLFGVRQVGITNLPISKKIFQVIGVFPIRDHYYEPMFNSAHLKRSLRADRELKGIDLNTREQLELIEKFNFNEELLMFPVTERKNSSFFYHNDYFEPGDAEYLYNIIRFFKPQQIIEVGSGYSTLMAINAITKNQENNAGYSCKCICIEPFENRWLEKLDVTIIRNIVENIDIKLFLTLDKNDILFIDSSHIIRPQGDVLFEFFEVLPLIKPGVLIHFHDIFTPKDYPDEWIIDEIKFWNEQYLLEAFLSFNKEFRVIGALNYLKHNYPAQLAAKCPILSREMEVSEPGSFWIMRN